jgi:N-acetylmuramic acid 6-phosphate etherase
VIGIAASGTTPYVVGALAKAREAGITTGCLVCNEDSPLEKQADIPVVLRTGAEFITGSTRMKAGTAQKLALNMFSTALMVRMGRVEGNRMVDMHLSNAKLIERGTRMVQKETGLAWDAAQKLLLSQGSVRQAVRHFKEGAS